MRIELVIDHVKLLRISDCRILRSRGVDLYCAPDLRILPDVGTRVLGLTALGWFTPPVYAYYPRLFINQIAPNNWYIRYQLDLLRYTQHSLQT